MITQGSCRECHLSSIMENKLECGRNRARGQYSIEIDEKSAVNCNGYWRIPVRDKDGRIVGFPHKNFTENKVVIEQVSVKNEREKIKEIDKDEELD